MMALSKPDIQGTAQHFLECGVEECERNCEFYCNPCHQQMCKQCRDEHLRSPETKTHEVVLYQLRKRQLPVKKCKIHPTKDIDLLCEECKIPLCSKCAATEEHRGHVFTDLELIYAEKFSFCLEEITKLRECFVPSSEDVQREIKEDVMGIKKIMDNLRTSMKSEAESLKSLVDTVVCENMKQLEQIENSLLEDLKTQDKTLNDYTIYLNNLIKELHGFLSSPDPTKLTLSLVDMKIKPIPETTKPVTPVFSSGQYGKEDVVKLLGKISIPEIKPKTRKIKTMEILSNLSEKKLTNIQPFPVTEVRELYVPGLRFKTSHLSLDQSGRLWVSDNETGCLVQIDLQGNRLQTIHTSGGSGYHTVTQDGDLIFTDHYKKVINRVTMDNRTTKMIKTKDWEPWSIYSSNITEDILAGMVKGKVAKVTRYNKTGKELQNIQRDNKGQELYSDPHYITENINGDICTSDYDKKAVVVVDKSGQHRFSYTGQGSTTFSFTGQKSDFRPFGICTDVRGRILVCDQYTILLLDQDGQFLSSLLEPKYEIVPLSVCVDDENNLYLGRNLVPVVTVYKYLQ